ncbi:hypothetical protein [uncultured Microscilla sp.]|uniref:hypothetical protein n=1 Tax=uncultured Microscilla sp. TaxID=432653 RepID=UPI00262A796B|nr:hypothetical protein [uncultured Microscilla sp.]
MTRYCLICLLTITIIPYTLKAQNKKHVFRVLASSGKSSLVDNSQQLRVGQKIYQNQKIKVEPKSYLSLVNRQGGTVQISKKGEYTAKSLLEQLTKMQKTAAQQYATYVIKELTKARVRNPQKNRYKYMNVTGSVNRAESPFKLNIAPQNSVNKFISKKATVHWYPVVGTTTYNVVVMNEFDEKLYAQEVKDTSLVIDFDKAPYKGQEMCVLKITSKERPKATSLRYSLIMAADNQTVKKAFADFKKENPVASNNAADVLEEAFFYEENELFSKALKCYEKAIELSKGNNAYKVAYHHFLIRHAIGDYEKYKQK